MGTDHFFSVQHRDAPLGCEALSFVLPRVGSTGPFLARYAELHTESPTAPYRYVLTAAQWNDFMEELYAQQNLLRELAACVLSVFDFDQDVPKEIREPQLADWLNLLRFEQWVIRVFGHTVDGRPEAVFSLETEHFHRGVTWAWDLCYWLDLDPVIREALRDPENLVFLLIG